MPIPYYEHSGRKPHFWKLRRNGYRDLLQSKGWSFRGAYAEKTIAGRTVMLRNVENREDHFLCRLELKDDFWANITSDARQEEAEQRRAEFAVVQDEEETDYSIQDEELFEQVISDGTEVAYQDWDSGAEPVNDFETLTG